LPNSTIGAAREADGNGRFNSLAFVAEQADVKNRTMELVQVVTVTPGAGLAPDIVAVQPMVNQIDGSGNATPHGQINGIPVWMMYGAGSAVKITPAVGDIGLLIISDRDISSVKSNAAVSNPGSRRVFDFADGVYLGGVLNAPATQSIVMNSAGITITSATVTINATNIVTTGLLTNNGHAVGSTHVHGGVSTGGSDTGTPI
jgi:hypothetical protein